MKDVLPPQPSQPQPPQPPQNNIPIQSLAPDAATVDTTASAADQSRSIRNIPVPPNRRHFVPLSEEYIPNGDAHKHGTAFWIGSISFVFLCLVAGLFVANIFAGATVTVHPKTAQVTLPQTLSAVRNAPSGMLSFQTMTLSQSAERTVSSTGMVSADTPAQGTITIYNAFGTASQTLIANTRFESPSGKIYRIHEQVVVPGTKKSSSGAVTPGSVSVTAYADQPGPDYNTGGVRLTIPGFKNTSRYTKFYAETQGIAGGASGSRPAVAAADLQSAKNDIEQEISQELSKALGAQVPNGSIPVTGAVAVVYGDMEVTDMGGNKAKVTETATATIPIVDVAAVASIIATIQVGGYQGEAVTFTEPESLVLSLETGATFDANTASIAVTPSGASTLVWAFDGEKIRGALAGKAKTAFDSVISTFSPAVAKADASIFPFWKTSFPSDESKITIKTAATK